MPFIEPRFGEPALSGSTFVLERRVNRPSQVVAKTLRDRSTVAPAKGFALEEGTLLVDDPPRLSHASVPGRQTWRTTGELRSDRGRLVSRLDIEVGAWTPNSVFIQMRPIGCSPQRWGSRRTRRYFTLAHAGADRLERLLSEPAPDPGYEIRPIDPDDVDGLRGLFRRLSPESRYFRFLNPVTEPAESCLHYLAEVDHQNRDALVATVGEQVVAVARYDRDRADPHNAEVAVVVEDSWHRHGIATALLRALSGVATQRGVEHFTATVAADNRAVPKLVRSFPVRATWTWDHGQRELAIDL
jgi:GNAT superfamily N-acetyltransferase